MDQINKALLNQLTQKIGVMKGMQMSDEEIEKSFDKSELDLIEKAVVENDIQKGGSRAVLGEIRKFGGRDYIKTHDGWKFHGKGTGAKAQEHSANAMIKRENENSKDTIYHKDGTQEKVHSHEDMMAKLGEKEEPKLDTGKTSDIARASENYKQLVAKFNAGDQSVLSQMNDAERFLGLPETKEEVKADDPNVTIDNKEWKFDDHAMNNLSANERKEIVELMSTGYFGTRRLIEDNNKVEIKPGGEYSLSQFANSLGKTNSDAAQRKFIKENKDGFYNYSTDDRTSSEEVATLVTAVGDKNNIFNYFNKNYSPTNIQVKDVASIKEQVKSNNIYAVMAADQYKVREFSFQVKVKYTEAPITVKTRILMNNTLSMRDIANFM